MRIFFDYVLIIFYALYFRLFIPPPDYFYCISTFYNNNEAV